KIFLGMIKAPLRGETKEKDGELINGLVGVTSGESNMPEGETGNTGDNNLLSDLLSVNFVPSICISVLARLALYKQYNNKCMPTGNVDFDLSTGCDSTSNVDSDSNHAITVS